MKFESKIRIVLFVILLFPARRMDAQYVVESSGYKIPVYNEFKQIEPFFTPDSSNDTTYIFNFWATYCAPCIKELPYFEDINKKYSSQKVKVVLVSLDFKTKIESQLIPFLKKHNIHSNVVLLGDPDFNSWIDKVSATWSGAIPATLAIKGSKREFFEKSFTYNELELLINKF